MTRPILIAGPTASGKSALALELAGAIGGAVINADSQQVYAEWRLLTARPTPADESRAPHHLYGHVPVARHHSVGDWLREIDNTLRRVAEAGLRPIIVGGTGLYMRALTEGLAPIPPVPAELRQAAEALLAELGPAGLAARLAERDPETAAAIDAANPARLLRAWEVLEATGTGLAAWQRRTGPARLPLSDADCFALLPDRDMINARADRRFDAMLEAGVLAEAEAVLALGLKPSLPGMKAVGAPELFAHLRGETSLEAAVEAAKTATRRYAKRQLTWIRNQMRGWTQLSETNPARAAEAVQRQIAGRKGQKPW